MRNRPSPVTNSGYRMSARHFHFPSQLVKNFFTLPSYHASWLGACPKAKSYYCKV